MERFCILFLCKVLFLHSCILQIAFSSTNFTDQSALLAFKSNIIYDPTNTILGGNWTTTTNFCDWIGVSCTRRKQRVTALDLSYMGLQGTISPYVGNLSFLVSLDLRNNSFYGVVPHEISRLHRLRILILQANQFEGNIPPSLQSCRKLEVISLSINRLRGGIPEELGTLPKLHGLYLSVNNLAGSIPSSLANISTLQILSLGENSLTGSVPFTIFNISSLLIVALKYNSISGALPMDLCHRCPNIHEFYIGFNQFNGQLPSTMYQCKELVVLSMEFNRLDGPIPREIESLQNLEQLYLGGNNLTGGIPPTIGNMSRLQTLYIEESNLGGIIPNDLGRLSNLKVLNLQINNLTGIIPTELFNISSLQFFSLAINSLSGNLPSIMGFGLPNLEGLYLAQNLISGRIPSSISNFSNLVELGLTENLLSGAIPTSLGKIKPLQQLLLDGNWLTGEPGNPELSFLAALSNCRVLKWLSVEGNPLKGTIPDSIQNFSTSLQYFRAAQCQINGHIPRQFGLLKGLTWLSLGINNLTGEIPSSFGELKNLQRLHLQYNMIEGSIPEELCHLPSLGELYLSNNKISGSIPNCIGNLSQLKELVLNSNRLSSSIPENLWGLEDILYLNLSFNSLRGDLTQIMRKLNVIQRLDLSSNQISGKLPSIIGEFESLSSLILSSNLFQGSIPASFGDLKGLDFLDLSYNNMSGTIPKSLEGLFYLRYLNLSFNEFLGEIPSGGPFANFTVESFLGNQALCGKPIFHVPPCPSSRTRESRTKQFLLKYILPAIASAMVSVSFIFLLRKHRKSKAQITSLVDSLPSHPMISYEEIRRGTNNFCESNLLGVGSFGNVYKGILSDRTIVAVKVLNLQLESAFKSFEAECRVLRTIRHRNLVEVISTCSNPEFRALVLHYMSNGSLEKWLYSHNYCLDLLQRLSIAIDVASALEYLHHGQTEPVVHCDLKPSNILLDEDIVAHVGDFGIAKILAANKDAVQTKTLGTLGYIAPEYGFEGKVSTRGDIYSYGILLLEIFTRKKPTDEMFSGDLSLRQWVNASLPSNVMEVADSGLMSIEDGADMIATDGILLSILEIGLDCSEELPEKRIDIKRVVVRLNKIKLTLLRSRNNIF